MPKQIYIILLLVYGFKANALSKQPDTTVSVKKIPVRVVLIPRISLDSITKTDTKNPPSETKKSNPKYATRQQVFRLEAGPPIRLKTTRQQLRKNLVLP
ncbi:MAG: hypothetical protein H7Y13_16090 [Sphingobacteriaceae bacterium]|nr:hypothetical protein [Sphingobacteriaceae bacterium]